MTAPSKRRLRSSAGCLITPSTTMLRITRQPSRKFRPTPEHLSLREGERPYEPHYPEEFVLAGTLALPTTSACPSTPPIPPPPNIQLRHAPPGPSLLRA